MARKKESRRITREKLKKLFFTFMDSIILLSFALSVYFTLTKDYMRTILSMSIGVLLLMFFIIRGVLKTTRIKF